MKLPRFSRTEWALLLMAIIVLVILLSGCGSVTRSPEAGEKDIPAGPASVLAGLSMWATWAAGVGLFLCGIAAFFIPSKAWQIGKCALGCVVALLVAGILYWLADHWALALGLCVVALVLGAVGWVWCNRKAIECKTGIDLDGDGHICDATTRLMKKPQIEG